jgi:hypothetical protein
MFAGSGGQALGEFGWGFTVLLLGALGVQYSKWLEVGSRRQPREEPNPYFESVRRSSGPCCFCAG